jgi:hypothetical protein
MLRERRPLTFASSYRLSQSQLTLRKPIVETAGALPQLGLLVE